MTHRKPTPECRQISHKGWTPRRPPLRLGAAQQAAMLLVGGVSILPLMAAIAPAPSSAQTSSAAASAGMLSSSRGKVEIKSGDQKAARSVSATGNGGGVPIHGGDIITVGAGGQATLLLSATRQAYEIAADSQVRIAGDGTMLRPVYGPLPRHIDVAAAAGALAAHRAPGTVDHLASMNDQRFRQNTLASLLDGRLQASVTRGGASFSPAYAPIDITPLFGIAASSKDSVTLQWSGPVDPTAGSSTRFHVKIVDRSTGASVFAVVRPLNARDVVLPPGTLTPGVWYQVTIEMAGDSPSGALSHRAAGCLRLLTADERAELQKHLREADQDPARADLLRARAYETAGMTTEAIAAYESALRSSQLPPDAARGINADLAFLYQIETITTTAK